MQLALRIRASASLIRRTTRNPCAQMFSSSSNQYQSAREWPFAALDPATAKQQQEQHQKPKLLGIVFDVDGTLCEPQNYMFGEMRSALGIPKSVDILDHLESLPPGEQETAHEKIRVIERRAMKAQKPQPGLASLMEYLDSRGIRKALCTRNFEEPVDHLLRTFLPQQKFSPIITRTFKPPKPDPAGVLHIAREWGNTSDETAKNMIMVGDSLDDMLAGSRAGALTILLLGEDQVNQHVKQHESVAFCVARLEDIIPALEHGTLAATAR